jgi:hypothetical protein
MSAGADIREWRAILEGWWTAWPIAGPFDVFQLPDPSVDPSSPTMYLEWGPEYDQKDQQKEPREATFGGTVIRTGKLRVAFWYQRGTGDPDLETLESQVAALWGDSSTSKRFVRPKAADAELQESVIAPWSGYVLRFPFTVIDEPQPE